MPKAYDRSVHLDACRAFVLTFMLPWLSAILPPPQLSLMTLSTLLLPLVKFQGTRSRRRPAFALVVLVGSGLALIEKGVMCSGQTATLR